MSTIEYLPKYFKFVYIEDGVTKTAYLVDEPISWDKVPVILKRDTNYHGVNYQFTDGDVQLEFDEDSRVDIIELIYVKDGQDGSINLIYGHINDDLSETIEYEGKLNLNTRKKMNGRVTCTIENAGFHELINSREEMNVNIFDTKTIDNGNKVIKNPIDVTLHSQALQRSTLVKGGIYQEASFSANIFNIPQWFHLPFAGPSPDDIQTFYGTGIGIFNFLEIPANPPADYYDNYTFLDFTENGNFKFNFNLIFRTIYVGVLDHFRIKFWCRIVRSGAVLENILVYDSGNLPRYNKSLQLTNYVHTLSTGITGSTPEFTRNLLVGDKLYCFGQFDFGSLDGDGTFMINTEYNDLNPETMLQITALTQLPDTLSKGMLTYECLQSIIESITGSSNLLKSEFFGRIANGYALDGTGSKFLITNGFFIRNFNITGRALNITLKSILQSLKAIWNIGVSYEYVAGILKFVIEDINHYFQDNEIIRITEYSDYSEETAKEFIYNEVEVGYNKFQDEGSYLLDEFNSKLQFSTPIKTNKAKLPITSDLIASGYAIEDTRRQQFSEAPIDSSAYDDDNFIIAVRLDGSTWKSETDQFITTNNILSGTTAYNLKLTPKRNLVRWARWINGGLVHKNGFELIKNTFFKWNGIAQTKMTGETVFLQENADIVLNNFENRNHFFDPTWINLKTRLNIDDIQIIKNAFNGLDPTREYGYITVVVDGVDVQGYLYQMQFNPSKEEVTMKLLKKDFASGVLTCSNYSEWTFAQFESAALPSWIEQCIFDDFI
jgi:hypothetical protein